MKRNLEARSYADVSNWRDYEAELPAAFQLAGEHPEEEWFNWRDIAVKRSCVVMVAPSSCSG